ncbi:Sucrase/ferredoxin-like-domain-containing protein [Mycotypha africana]|uniref:Sucrase/ferredoxin-like-domain-containing protein n=1 Tax=Mycotypha africana TaxID=64632 RepID=UPI0023007A68|nr:Sucrase/ferredoxin-like-domain-containing protein [Mycotypha africana]KAI8975399.1 Sucrase/ferredoxin-like-domain-containing protein [Mycotypha africana]
MEINNCASLNLKLKHRGNLYLLSVRAASVTCSATMWGWFDLRHESNQQIMVSYLKKSLATLAGFGDVSLLPPEEFISTTKYSTNDDEDDCTGCLNPCVEHKEYPSYLNIDMDFPILGSVKPYGRHIIIATGVSDWPKKIEHVEGTFAHSLIEAEACSNKNAWKNLITNSSMVSTFSTLPNSCDVLIFPDNIIVSNVTNEKAYDFYGLFLASPLPTKTEPVDIDLLMKDDRMEEMTVTRCPYKNLLLICSHKKRDKRCGITAPILAQEFDHVLREKNASEYDVAVAMVSHIGVPFINGYSVTIGHQVAGNVICYVNDGSRGIWYGRVKACHCRSIVEETIMKGKVIKDIYRGAMDNSFEKRQQKKTLLKW